VKDCVLNFTDFWFSCNVLLLFGTADMQLKYRLEQCFQNFFWSRTSCGKRAVTTCHFVPGKRFQPNIIRSKV